MSDQRHCFDSNVIATWSTLRSANLCPASHVAHSPPEFAILKLQSSFLHKNHSKFNFQLIGAGFVGLLTQLQVYDRENAILWSHSDNNLICFHQISQVKLLEGYSKCFFDPIPIHTPPPKAGLCTTRDFGISFNKRRESCLKRTRI